MFLKKLVLAALCACMMLATTACSTGTQVEPENDSNKNVMSYTAGTYTGTARGRNGDVVVEVTFTKDAIENVTIVEQVDTYGQASGMDTTPVEVYPSAIVEAQSLAIDTITGVTITCHAIKNAVADCVEQAGGDVETLKNTPVTKEETTDISYDVDVVVVGGGIAGLSSAIQAANNGASVLLLEKQGITGGATIRSGGKMIAAGTKWQEAQGIEDTPEMMFDFLKEIGGDLMNDELIRLYADGSSDLLLWIEEQGVQFQDVEKTHSDNPIWRVHNPYGGGGQVSGGSGNGAQLIVPLTANYMSTENKIEYNAEAFELLTNDKGQVTGVLAKKPDGSIISVNADSVILCTGGYAQNAEMMQRYEETTKDYKTLVPSSSTGDGIVMAEKIGAQVFDSPATQVIYTSMTTGAGINEESGLIVNAEGVRVVNEYSYQYHVGQGIANSGSAYGYYIASMNDPYKSVQYGMTLESTPHASSAEELAELIGVDATVLKETIERYNELCKNGVDEDFGKNAEKMIPLEGELYALRMDPSVTVTYGGLMIDTNSRVLDINNEPIPGLYAAGEVAFTGMVGTEYPSCGLAIGVSAFYGQIAGDNASK